MARWTMMVGIGVVASVLAIPGAAAAATIYGIIQQGNQPVSNTQVVLACGGTEVARATTDDRGNYRLTVARTGRCDLQVGGASGQVNLYPDPTRYNFEMAGTRLIRR
jgi:hypothetical protein